MRYAGNEFIPTETKLFVGMIPKYYTELELNTMFSLYGAVKEIHIMRDLDGHSKGCAFIKMGTVQDAQNAVSNLHDTNNMDNQATPRNLVVKIADINTQNKTNKPNHMNEQMRYSRQSSTSNSQYSSPHHTPHHLLNTYNNYSTPYTQANTQQYPQLLNLSPSIGGLTPSDITNLSPYQTTHQHTINSTILPNLQLSPSIMHTTNQYPSRYTWSQQSSPTHGIHTLHHYVAPTLYHAYDSNARPVRGESGCNLFIYSIPDTIDDDQLATYFTSYGTVISSKVYRDRFTGASRGFGFISYDNTTSASNAVNEMNGTMIGNKKIKVMLKTDKINNNIHMTQQHNIPSSYPMYNNPHLHQSHINDINDSFIHLDINELQQNIEPIVQH